MSTLSREHRRLLENTVVRARAIAEEGARKVLSDQYAVHHNEPWPHMTAGDRELRKQLRALGRQLGDNRDTRRETQEIKHLAQACAYEHWHRMLFARFLAENDLLLDAQHGVAMTLDEVRELAREQGRDWVDVAAALAQRMLLAVFRPDDPVLNVQLPPETRQQLEDKLALLPTEIFRADDSLGWVYQFWQSEEKKRINDAEIKIGADELPAVTELFTEDYMVLFLLHNTLGAWWTAKRKIESKDPNLPGYQWTYLRLKEDGLPSAGNFDGWPRSAKDIKLLDPSMGSGHFLVFALPILLGFRMEEEGLTREEAVEAVLRDNLFGLEIDPRCTQIAAFNLAWTAWRMIGYRPLPKLNLACSGLGINAKEEDWLKLASKDSRLVQPMQKLYALFRQAPLLGSLIEPTRVDGTLFTAEFEQVRSLLEQALSEEQQEEDRDELKVAAQGIVKAATILADKFTLVATNVPYLSRSKQNDLLREYCDTHFSRSKNDLATAFLERSLKYCSSGGTSALVIPTNWLVLSRYRNLREHLLQGSKFEMLARLGPGAFETISGEVVNVALLILSNSADPNSAFAGIEAGEETGPDRKATKLREGEIVCLKQRDQLQNPDARILLEQQGSTDILKVYADSRYGLRTGDLEKLARFTWELPSIGNRWKFLQGTVRTTRAYGGRERVLLWEEGKGQLHELADEGIASIQGADAWGKRGIAVSLMSDLPVTLYTGEIFDNGTGVIWSYQDDNLPAIYAFCASQEFNELVRKIDHSIKVTNQTLLKVPFDLPRWRAVAARTNPQGLPGPLSADPTQWLFNGSPKASDHPLHVAIARLLGYRWPRQNGSAFSDCPALGPDALEKHANDYGIVPLNAIAGDPSAADQLRRLLAEAYGNEWSAAKLKQLLGDWDSLEGWLSDGFFEEHCRIFHQRPFVWHVWDGRKDGFQALVNFHKIAAPAEGRNTLEKLIYTYLGRWIERQTDDVRSGKEGADGRLTAATHLRTELEKILRGEKPYDIFVRWKPLHEQPMGWDPDINDGVRINIRPWLRAKPYQPAGRDACILRVTPRVQYGKDRGKEPYRPKEDFPWFWTWDEQTEDFMGTDKFDGSRWNDLHYSLSHRKEAREKSAKTTALRS